MHQRRDSSSRQPATDFWQIAGESIADAEAKLRSAAVLLGMAREHGDAAPDVLRADLARALADLSAAAERVDARLAGLVALPMLLGVPSADPSDDA